MPTWRELEAEFRDLRAVLRYSRIDAQWGTSGEYWRLAGSNDSNARRRFEALAYTAGEKLSETLKSSPGSHQEVLFESDPIRRWYKGIWKIGDNFEYAFTAQELDDNGKVVGHIYTGSIEDPAEASSVFCLELAARFPEREHDPSDQRSFLSVFWEKYGTPITIGVIATVLGGLILAVLLQT
jgi:hypothetical protein